MPIAVTLIAIVALHLVPGWVISTGVPVLRRRIPLAGRLAAAVALSIAQLMVLGMGLIVVELAFPAVIVATNLVVTAAVATVTRHHLLADIRAAAAAVGTYRPEWRSGVVVWILAGVVGAYVIAAHHGLPYSAAPWGYAGDVDGILRVGGLPETHTQYGETIAYVATKVGAFAWFAAVRVFSGMDYPASIQYLSLAALFGALIAAWAILRTFLGRIGAATGMMLLFHEQPLGLMLWDKYRWLTVEGAGITLGLLAVWAVIAADRRREQGLHWLAGGMVLLTGFTHGVAAVMTVVFIASYQLARILRRKLTWRQILRNAAVLGVVPAVLLIAGLRLVFPAPGFAITGGGYELVDGVGDPTRALKVVVNGGSLDDVGPPVTPDAGTYYESFFERSFDNGTLPHALAERSPPAMTIVAAGLAVAAWFLRRRQAALTLTLFMLALMAIAIVFSIRYDLYIFTEHPIRRHFRYAGLAVTGLLMAAASGVPWRPSGKWRAVTAGLVTILVAAFTWSLATSSHRWGQRVIRESDQAALDWVRDNTPPDARILSNVRTTAAFLSYAGRVSITEGDTPYIYPAELTRTLGVLDRGQDWFEKPDRAYLVDNGIDYIVLADRRSRALGGNVYAPLPNASTLNERLSRRPFLTMEEEIGRVVIYSVHFDD